MFIGAMLLTTSKSITFSMRNLKLIHGYKAGAIDSTDIFKPDASDDGPAEDAVGAR